MSRLHSFKRLQRYLICTLGRRLPFCLGLLPTPTPIRLLSYKCGLGTARQLLVFLPGIGDTLEDYQLNGFIEAVRRRGIDADMIVADLHLGYYMRRIAFERLRHDIILPSRQDGYTRIHLVGISLGGFGALHYAMRYPEDISCLFLLAPYLGDAAVIKEISAAGGVRQWEPDHISEDDYQRKLWLWLKGYGDTNVQLPELYLAYGDQDIFASAQRLLGDILPAERVYTVRGKHDWATWRRLWDFLLDSRAYPSSTLGMPTAATGMAIPVL